MNDLTQSFFLVCVMASGALGGWMTAFVASVCCILFLIWRETVV